MNLVVGPSFWKSRMLIRRSNARQVPSSQMVSIGHCASVVHEMGAAGAAVAGAGGRLGAGAGVAWVSRWRALGVRCALNGSRLTLACAVAARVRTTPAATNPTEYARRRFIREVGPLLRRQHLPLAVLANEGDLTLLGVFAL